MNGNYGEINITFDLSEWEEQDMIQSMDVSNQRILTTCILYTPLSRKSLHLYTCKLQHRMKYEFNIALEICLLDTEDRWFTIFRKNNTQTSNR